MRARKSVLGPGRVAGPGLASGKAREIIDYLGELSAPFGTRIDFVDGVGLIRP